MLDLCCDIKEALRPQKKAILRSPISPRKTNEPVQRRVRSAGGKVEVACPAFRIEPPGNSDGFEERGLAAAILPDEERNRGMQWQNVEIPYRRQRKGITLERGYLIP